MTIKLEKPVEQEVAIPEETIEDYVPKVDYKVLILAVSNQASQADNVLPYESAMEMVRDYLKDNYKLLSVDFLGAKRILGNSTNAYEFAWHFLKA